MADRIEVVSISVFMRSSAAAARGLADRRE